MDTLRARDKTLHSRMLHGSIDVFNFTLQRNSDPNSFGFYTKNVKLGSPPKEFTILVDIESNAMRVNCKTCSKYPHSNALGFKLNFFDTTASSTALLVQSLDIRCPSKFEITTIVSRFVTPFISEGNQPVLWSIHATKTSTIPCAKYGRHNVVHRFSKSGKGTHNIRRFCSKR
ncbi:aspartic proteinase 39-like isoform X5 [Cicer arietinum]|uniref:aspartic proteinase 39-like isoform X5 n=1 Tax=Cicer arietinum TaxID=3827 RepID=UPI003CC688AC